MPHEGSDSGAGKTEDREQWTISVIGLADEEADNVPEERGWRRSRDLVAAETDIRASDLGERLNALLSAFGESLKGTPSSVADFQLAEVTIAIEISASGRVHLLGTGAEVGGKGGLTVKLARTATALDKLATPGV